MIYFTLVERFNADLGSIWKRYKSDNDLEHLQEIISLDSSLCPAAEEDGENTVFDDQNFSNGDSELYSDLKKSVDAIPSEFDAKKLNLLAINFRPEKNKASAPYGFKFVGYDLLDISTRTSAITNCGRLEKAFDSKDINLYGLINDLDNALRVQRKIRDEYPNLSHSNTTITGIWIK